MEEADHEPIKSSRNNQQDSAPYETESQQLDSKRGEGKTPRGKPESSPQSLAPRVSKSVTTEDLVDVRPRDSLNRMTSNGEQKFQRATTMFNQFNASGKMFGKAPENVTNLASQDNQDHLKKWYR